MCHRNIVGIPIGRHCFVRHSDGSTTSFDPERVGPDRDPDSEQICTRPQEPEKEDCIRDAMAMCEDQYHLTQFNCCHCVEQAMKECGATPIPLDSWPNWPVNPGPQPGEPGWSPMPVYGDDLGK